MIRLKTNGEKSILFELQFRVFFPFSCISFGITPVFQVEGRNYRTAKKKLMNVALKKYQRLYEEKKYGELANELAKAHKKNSAFPCDLIMGYIKEEPDPEFYMLEVEDNKSSVFTERLIPYRFTDSSIFPAPSVVIPCSWQELEAAVRDKDSLLRPFIAKGEVYVGNSEAKKRWELLSSQFRVPKKI